MPVMKYKKKLRVAILTADTLKHQKLLLEKYGNYFDLFSKLFQNAKNNNIDSSENAIDKIKLELLSFDVMEKMEYPSVSELNDIDGVLITGSVSSAYDDEPWIHGLVKYTKDLIENHKHVKLVGVCFGHQIVGKALGVPVVKNPLGFEVGVHKITLTDPGKKLAKADNEFLDIVTILPEGFVNIGATEKCAIHGMIKDNHVLTIQGHPEYFKEWTQDLLMSRRDLFSRDEYEQVFKAAELDHEGVWFGQKILRFFAENSDSTVDPP
ncbi:8595_t:CDS:2 [Ambispora gerdemannii]|uniref:8595_t:CDS:1 n=1 Tax=Ambispora gerdemannii TaxID=144530 RepID=A0A9N8V5H4_9GLOM|nr:8595_t:CDS:2 [Ambispora gerdemannii]